METRESLRHQIIKSLMAQHSEQVAETAIQLWEQMTVQIISIIGEKGFNSLYARSIFLNHSVYPWLATISLPAKPGQRFAELKRSFEGQQPEQIKAANSLLMITFTDILASLIGEQLTTRIIQLTWSHDLLNRANKESENE